MKDLMLTAKCVVNGLLPQIYGACDDIEVRLQSSAEAICNLLSYWR